MPYLLCWFAPVAALFTQDTGDPIMQSWTNKKSDGEKKGGPASILVIICVDLSRRSFLWLPAWSRRGELDLFLAVLPPEFHR
jgi:hypothetical protein